LEDDIGKGLFGCSEVNWNTLEGVKKQRAEAEKNKAKLLKDIAEKKYGNASVNWQTRESMEKNIEDWQKEIAKIKKETAAGIFSAAIVNWQTRNGVNSSIAGLQKEIDDINSAMTDGTYGVPEFGWQTRNGIDQNIVNWQKIIDTTKSELSQKKYGCPECNWRTEEAVEQRVKAIELSLTNRKEEFTSENWWGMGGTRRQLEQLRLQVLVIEEETGLKSEKVKALQARETELKKYLAHDFLTALPEEESTFMKAISWCSNAIKEVNKAAEKFKKIKKVITIIKTATNPAKAADLLLKEATGKGFFEFVGEKMLPEKVFNNPVVQTILKGGKIDHKELVEKFAKENLPPELIETIKTFEDMKDNPEAFVRSKMYDEVMTVVEGNPKLKQTYQSFKEAEKFIKNPELIEKRLEESLKQYGDELLKNAEGKIVETVMSDERAQKLKEQLENYRERLNRIQSDSTEKIDKFTENVAAGITRNLQNAMEETVGLKKEITPFVQDFVDGYSFTD
jgi:hypothetical protein